MPESASGALLLDGRLALRQPRRGHRVGTDTMLLAACLADPGSDIVDAGAGVGAVGLAVALRSLQARVSLVERQADLAALARENVSDNGLLARARVLECDLLDVAARRAAGLPNGAASAVYTNPPYYEAGSVRASPHEGRALAHVLGEGGLAAWMLACLALLAPGGRFAMIHRPAALRAILDVCKGRLGAIRITPVQAREGEDAGRILLTGRKGSRAATTLAAALVVHTADGRFTPRAEAIHRGLALVADS